MYKLIISAKPFTINNKIKGLLKKKKIFPVFVDQNQIFKEIVNSDFYIAGTEVISNSEILKAKKLKMISRVGIGLDNLDINFLKKKNIKLSYTPDAQSESVAEFTIGLILCLSRNIIFSNNYNKIYRKWVRPLSDDIKDLKFGIIGVGRIGKRVFQKLKKLGAKKIKVFDIDKKKKLKFKNNFFNLKALIKDSDVISLHIPGEKKNNNFFDKSKFLLIKNNALIINTSRGNIINEKDLLLAMKNKNIKCALDVHKNEPKINQKFINNDNAILTSHIAAMTSSTRQRMEYESVESIIDYLEKKKNNRFLI